LEIFCNYIIHNDGYIYIQEFIELLNKYQFKLSGLSLEKSMDIEEESEKES